MLAMQNSPQRHASSLYGQYIRPHACEPPGSIRQAFLFGVVERGLDFGLGVWLPCHLLACESSENHDGCQVTTNDASGAGSIIELRHAARKRKAVHRGGESAEAICRTTTTHARRVADARS